MCSKYIASIIIVLDCPNGFKPYNNKCYRWLTQNSFSEHVKNCDLFSGKLLSATFEATDPDILVAKKMMNSQSQDKIYLGKYAPIQSS